MNVCTRSPTVYPIPLVVPYTLPAQMLHLQDSGIYSCNTRSGLIKGKSLVKKERKERGKGNTRLFHTAKPAWLSLYIETSFIAVAPLSVVPYFRRVCPLSYLLMTARSVPFSVFLKTFNVSLHPCTECRTPSFRHVHSDSDLAFCLLQSYCCLSSELFYCVHHLSQL